MKAMLAERRVPAREEVERYFQAVWDASREGELYDLRPANLERFLAALLEVCAGAAPTSTSGRSGAAAGA